MNEVAILGVSMHPWGKIKGKSVPDLNLEVAQNALKDAGLEWKDIQFVVAGSDPGAVSTVCWPAAGYRRK